MDKVIIEVTKEGWSTTVKLARKVFVEKHKATSTGSKAVEGNFEKEEEIGEELCDALSGFTQYNIMAALRHI